MGKGAFSSFAVGEKRRKEEEEEEEEEEERRNVCLYVCVIFDRWWF